jgi:hypothetical protein
VFAVLVTIEHRHGWGRAYGGAQWHCFGRQMSDEKMNNKKIQHDLRWPAFDDSTHNNQPKTRGWDQAGLREEVQPGESAQGG